MKNRYHYVRALPGIRLPVEACSIFARAPTQGMTVRVLCHECFDYFFAEHPSGEGPVECPVCGNRGQVKTDQMSDDWLVYYLEPRNDTAMPEPDT